MNAVSGSAGRRIRGNGRTEGAKYTFLRSIYPDGRFCPAPGTDNLLTQVYLDGARLFAGKPAHWYDLQPERIQAYGGFYVQSVTDRNG